MTTETNKFDCEGFYKAINSTREARDLNWKQVSSQTGVGASTLTRMSQNKRPDADSLALLAAWSGVNPADYVITGVKITTPEPLVMLANSLRSDPTISKESAKALETIFKAAYEQFQNKNPN